MNSLIAPLNMMNSAANSVATNFTNAANTVVNNLGLNNSSNSDSSFGWIIALVIILAVAGAAIALMVTFQNEMTDAWNSVKETVTGYFGTTPTPITPPTPTPEDKEQNISEQNGLPGSSLSASVEKILPGGAQVFNVSSNKFTYYDAAPLCKAMGAELATYEQVKDAWSKGADWCNYGWVKGQMAVYPTSDETYSKLQGGPEEQRMSCGRPGVNGGYFDNPEMKFGVNCYGSKPPQRNHDAEAISKGAPISPDALAFDKKVNQYKTEADSIGINPFNSNRW